MSKILATKSTPPSFSVTDARGKKLRLENYKSKYILVVFLRYAGCPYCNLAVHRLSIEYEKLKDNGCEVIAFVQSSEENIVKNIYNRHAKKPQFSIVADPKLEVYKKYGVGVDVAASLKDITKIPYWLEAVRKHGFKQTTIDGNLFLVPAWFLINTEKKKIVKQQRGVSFYDHETFIDIYDSLIFKD